MAGPNGWKISKVEMNYDGGYAPIIAIVSNRLV